MGIAADGEFLPMVDDPDDYRPGSAWRLVVDPGGNGVAPLDTFALIQERCGAGERIPLHRHPVDELVTIIEGEARYRLGDAEHGVGPGDVVFIPAGVAHGMSNDGSEPVLLHAVFRQTTVGIDALERNPAPGTEHRAPGYTEYDFRTGRATTGTWPGT